MEEALWEKMKSLADVLHWMGKYEECNALIMACRIMRLHDLRDVGQWSRWVEGQEGEERERVKQAKKCIGHPVGKDCYCFGEKRYPDTGSA